MDAQVIFKYIFEIIGGLLLLTLFGLTCYAQGKQDANLELWNTPPEMAFCTVYADGGKKCVPKREPIIVSYNECVRACKVRSNMEKVK